MTRANGSRSSRLLVWIGQGALTIGAVLGVASVLLALGTVVFGIQPLVFRSGSMTPAIGTGALAFAHQVDADQLGPGDIVSVPNSSGVRVTHRVVSVVALADPPHTVSLTLKGDANASADPAPYLVTSADRVFAHVPYSGYLAALLSGPFGMFLAGLVVAGLVVWGSNRRRGNQRGGGHARSMASMSVVVAVVGAGTCANAVTTQNTLAAWVDTTTVQSANLATHQVAQPGVLTCETGLLGLLSMKISTTSADGRYEYVARVFNAPTGGTQVGTDKSMGTGSAGSVRSYSFGAIDFSGGLLNLGSTYYVRVYARIPGTSWFSQDYRTQAFSYTSVIIVGASYSCVA